MAKRIISQARGKGSFTYRVTKKAFKVKPRFPQKLEGEGTVVKLIDSRGHSAPLAKVIWKNGNYIIPAFEKMYEGQKLNLDGKTVQEGNVLRLGDMPVKTKVYSIECHPGDGGIFIKTGGNFATVNRIVGNTILVLMPSKKEKKFNPNCRAVIGVIAGAGRLDKPIMKAGKNHHIHKAKGKLYPRTSAIKVNAIDHPFGSGRGKNPKSKIAKRNAPPGARVGHIRPRRTGRKKK